MIRALVISVFLLIFLAPSAGAIECTFGCPRDWWVFQQCKTPPSCEFPPMFNPCAVPCRPPGIQKQAVPCAFKTACPAMVGPCYGVSYGDNPYPIFK